MEILEQSFLIHVLMLWVLVIFGQSAASPSKRFISHSNLLLIGTRWAIDSLEIDDEDRFRVVGQRFSRPDGIYTIYVGDSIEPIDESVATLRRSFFVGGPLLVILVTAVTWYFVGRALARVGRPSIVSTVPRRATRRTACRPASSLHACLSRSLLLRGQPSSDSMSSGLVGSSSGSPTLARIRTNGHGAPRVTRKACTSIAACRGGDGTFSHRLPTVNINGPPRHALM